jgi:hypothetical protein
MPFGGCIGPGFTLYASLNHIPLSRSRQRGLCAATGAHRDRLVDWVDFALWLSRTVASLEYLAGTHCDSSILTAQLRLSRLVSTNGGERAFEMAMA